MVRLAGREIRGVEHQFHEHQSEDEGPSQKSEIAQPRLPLGDASFHVPTTPSHPVAIARPGPPE